MCYDLNNLRDAKYRARQESVRMQGLWKAFRNQQRLYARKLGLKLDEFQGWEQGFALYTKRKMVP
jgi:hypothetical protein